MEIQNPRYVLNQGHPELHFEYKGRTAKLGTEIKPTLYEAGIVFLGPDFEQLVPEIVFKRTTLRGFTQDPKVFALYDAFGKSVMNGTFKPGPVSLAE